MDDIEMSSDLVLHTCSNGRARNFNGEKAIRCFTPNASVHDKRGAPYAVSMKAFDIPREIRACLRGVEYQGFLTSNVSMLSLLVTAARC